MADDIRRPEEEAQEEPERKIDLGASLRKEHKDKKPVNRAAVIAAAAAVIVVVAVLAVFLPKWIQPAQQDETTDLTVDLSNHESGQVVRITVDGESKFTVTKETVDGEDVYHVDALDDDKVNQGTCSSAFVNAARMEADQLVEQNAADLSIYGLDTPSCAVTVEYDDGELLELELGDQLEMSGQVYCRKKGETDVYILRQYFYNIFGGSILRYRGLTLPTLNSDLSYTKSIIIRQKGQEQIRFMPVESTTSSGTWKMTEPDELWLDSGYVSELVESLSNYKLYGYEGNYSDLAQFGLDEPWFEVIVSDTEGGKRTLRLGDELEGENRYYCTVDDTGDVFTISNSYLEFAEDFKVSHYLDAFTGIISISAVDALEISDGSSSYRMTIERQEQYEEDGSLKVLANGQPNYAETFFLNGKECQESAFKTAYQAIIGVTISNLADPSLVDETQQPVLTLTYTFNNGEAPQTVEYLPYDINNYCVRRDGKISLICKREAVDDIMVKLKALEAGELDKKED